MTESNIHVFEEEKERESFIFILSIWSLTDTCACQHGTYRATSAMLILLLD